MKNIAIILCLASCAAAIGIAKNLDKKIERNAAAAYDINNALKEIAKGKFDIPLWYSFIGFINKMKQTCPNFQKDVEEMAKEVSRCAYKEKPILKTTSVCKATVSTLNKCYKPIRDLLSSCLPKGSKNIPTLLAESFEALIKQVCSSTVEQMLELMNPCQFSTAFLDVPSCVDIKTEAESFTGDFPTQAFLCAIVPKIEKCSEDRHGTSCTNPISKVAFTNFYKAINEATKETCSLEEDE